MTAEPGELELVEDLELDWLVDAQLAPATEGGLEALYSAAAEDQLAMPFCGVCDQVLEIDQQICDACGSPEVTWRPVEPIGTVHSVTLVHRREPGLIRAESPYPVLDLELDSGHRLVMTTTGPAPEPPAIGQRLAVSFRTVGAIQIPAAEFPADTSSKYVDEQELADDRD
jgi:uncharacterized OB-fold protein